MVAKLRPAAAKPEKAHTLDELIERRAAFLTDYHNAAYARRYVGIVRRVREAEGAKTPGSDDLAAAAARGLFRLMAIKDEYEVARLYSDGVFAKQVAAAFDGELRFEFHLAPPFLRRKNEKGEALKASFGPWMMRVFRLLAPLKVLRETPFDVFGYTKERHLERKLIVDYEILLNEITDRLTPDNRVLAVALAELPEKVRGFGHVKLRAFEDAKAEGQLLLDQFRAAQQMKLAAE
jgi:indolepyruvate ferredoxin oxidoreductase